MTGRYICGMVRKGNAGRPTRNHVNHINLVETEQFIVSQKNLHQVDLIKCN